jgi:hypothetical protein
MYKGYEFECNGGSLSQEQNEYFIDLLEELKPTNICELGCGQSTRIFKKYCEDNNARLLSVEHDMNYVQHKNTALLPFKVGKFMDYEYSNFYVGFEKLISNYDGLFDFILIDGPIGTMDYLKYSRIQVIDFILFNKITDTCAILIHDTERLGERNTIAELEKLLKNKGYSFEKKTITDSIGRELTSYIIKK